MPLCLWLKRTKNLIFRKFRPFFGGRGNWSTIICDERWKIAVDRCRRSSKKSVLIATSTGSNWPCSSFDTLLGVALTLRGIKVSFLLCDGALPACQECSFQNLSPTEFANNGPQKSLCSTCYLPARKILDQLNLPVYTFSEFNKAPSTLEINPKVDLKENEHAIAGTLRYFAVGDAGCEPLVKNITQRYMDATSISSKVAKNLSTHETFHTVVLHHGIYVPQGQLLESFKNTGASIVTWFPTYRKKTVLFNHDESYHHSLPAESKIQIANWNDDKRLKIKRYIESRRSGTNDWISFYNDKQTKHKVSKPYPTGRNFGLFTNVLWDAQLHFKSSAFQNQITWIIETIKFFAQTPSDKLIIRIHPAEIKGTVPSRQPLAAEIYSVFPELPKNISIIGPTDDISSYEIADQVDIALVYVTKMAIELSCLGKPVIVSGDSWAKNKGFTIDAKSPTHYFSLLSEHSKIQPLSVEQIDLAYQYAYYLFFERMIEIASLEHRQHLVPFTVRPRSIDSIRKDRGLMKICDAIIDNKPFVHDPNEA